MKRIRQNTTLAAVVLISVACALVACGGGRETPPGPSITPPPGSNMAPLSLAITDAPPVGVSVLTFEITITGATQDEPVNGRGDGNTSPDARRASAGTNVFLRAERSGRENGRVYRIAFAASDGKGGTCDGTATVAVPRDRGKPAVDSAPPSYDSFRG